MTSTPFLFEPFLQRAASLFHQLSVLYTLPRLLPASLTLLLPYFATGTSESLHKEGQVGAHILLLKVLSPWSRCVWRRRPCSARCFKSTTGPLHSESLPSPSLHPGAHLLYPGPAAVRHSHAPGRPHQPGHP